MSKTSVERGEAPQTSGTADQVATEFHYGLEHRDLSKSIDEINKAKTNLTPKEYSAFIAGVNKSIDDNVLLPRLAVDIVGVDESGKNLVMVDLAAGTGSVVDAHGKTITTLGEKQMLAMMIKGRHLLDSKTAKPNADGFSVFMPPGLDTSGTGRLKIDSQKKSVDTKNGTTNTRVEGYFDDSNWGINFSGYESSGKTKYAGSLVTTPDGKLLESHTTYERGKFNDVVLFGGYQSSFPNIETGASFKVREFDEKGKVRPQHLDVKYNALEDAYYATLTRFNSYSHEGYKIKDGKAEWIKQGREANYSDDLARLSGAKLPTYDSRWELKKDADGYISMFRHDQDKVTITRDENHAITRLEDADKGVWTRTGDKQWNYERDGKTTVKNGDLFVDGEMNIILQKDDGAEITSIFGTKYNINKNGFVTLMDSGNTKLEYFYDNNQKMIKSIETEYRPPSEYNTDSKGQTIVEQEEFVNGKAPRLYPIQIK